MCNPVSWFWTVANGVGTLHISEKSDSHTAIQAEFGIRDTGIGSVCAGEFSPDADNPSPDPATWKLIWDYAGVSRRPEWMDDEMEASLRRQLEQRCKKYVFADGGHTTETSRAFVFGNAHLTANGFCNVMACDSSTVKAYDSSTVKVESKHAFVLGRGQYKDGGYPPSTCKLEVGKSYGIIDGVLAEKAVA